MTDAKCNQRGGRRAGGRIRAGLFTTLRPFTYSTTADDVSNLGKDTTAKMSCQMKVNQFEI